MIEIIKKINGWMLLAIITVIVVVSSLIEGGMFFDGLTYASIGEKYAFSKSFWELHYTLTLKYNFYEHPPLAFFTQMIFFETGLKENFYCLFCLLVSFFLLARIYILAGGERTMAWIPGLLFVVTPIVFWSFSNNMLENTMVVFVLLNIWFNLFLLSKNAAPYFYFISGILTVSCFLVKGPVGLFPLFFLPLHWYFINDKKDFRKYIQYFSFYLSGIVAMVLFFYFGENSYNFFKHYFNEQVFASISGKREIANSRFFILEKLFLELVVMIGVWVLLFFMQMTKKINKFFLFFTAIGLSASIPLLISAKQMGFYIVPSIPFFALGISFLVHEKVANYFRSWVLTGALLISFLGISFFVMRNSIDRMRDENQIELVMYFSNHLYYENHLVSISPKLIQDWALHAYLYKYCHISLDDKEMHLYYIMAKDETIPENYENPREFKGYFICSKKK